MNVALGQRLLVISVHIGLFCCFDRKLQTIRLEAFLWCPFFLKAGNKQAFAVFIKFLLYCGMLNCLILVYFAITTYLDHLNEMPLYLQHHTFHCQQEWT